MDSLTSRLEDVQTDLAEKERLNNELQQEKAALKVQVGKCKLPDEKGGAEVEQLQKQCATLESQIQQLESRMTEEQNKASTNEKALQKERKNTEKLQLALDEQSVRTRIMIEYILMLNSVPRRNRPKSKKSQIYLNSSLGITRMN